MEQSCEIASGANPRSVAGRTDVRYENINKLTRVCYGILSVRLRDRKAPIPQDKYALAPYPSCRTIGDRFVVGVVGLSASYRLGEVIDWMRSCIHPDCDARVDPRTMDFLELEIPLDVGIECDARGPLARFFDEVLTLRVVILMLALSLLLHATVAYFFAGNGSGFKLYMARFTESVFARIYHHQYGSAQPIE